MNAIPTKYAGVQFRSRLEARWSAFFDLVGWKWEYEPLDLRGYIPDFVITPPLTEPTLVEVKPIVHWPCQVRGCTGCNELDEYHRPAHDDALSKIEASGWSGPSILVGASLLSPGGFEVPRLGRSPRIDRTHAFDRVLGQCRRCPRYFLCEDGTWDYDWHNALRWCDCCDADAAYGAPQDPTALWREAGNRVQWRRPEGHR
jgi:hypothetical protein